MDAEQAKKNEKPYRVKEFADRADLSLNAVYEMIRRDVHRGIAALCLGGGNAVAMAVER